MNKALCPHCGYDLTGSAQKGACPECGSEYDPNLVKIAWTGPFNQQQLRRLWLIPALLSPIVIFTAVLVFESRFRTSGDRIMFKSWSDWVPWMLLCWWCLPLAAITALNCRRRTNLIDVGAFLTGLAAYLWFIFAVLRVVYRGDDEAAIALVYLPLWASLAAISVIGLFLIGFIFVLWVIRITSRSSS